VFITLWIFIISGVLLATIIGLKIRGVAGASIPGWQTIRAKCDPFFEQKIKQGKGFLARFEKGRLRQTRTTVVQRSRARVADLKQKTTAKITPFRDYIKGKRVVDTGAPASKFLNDIKKSKDQSQASNDRKPLS
jgi:hypothetical protein